MFLKNAWYVGAWDTEIGRQGLLRRTLLGEEALLVALLLSPQGGAWRVGLCRLGEGYDRGRLQHHALR